MPETYGLPEDEEPGPTIEERVVEAIAGVGLVRRMVLYSVAGATMLALSVMAGPLGVIVGGLGLLAVLLLSFTDKGLSQ